MLLTPPLFCVSGRKNKINIFNILSFPLLSARLGGSKSWDLHTGLVSFTQLAARFIYLEFATLSNSSIFSHGLSKECTVVSSSSKTCTLNTALSELYLLMLRLWTWYILALWDILLPLVQHYSILNSCFLVILLCFNFYILQTNQLLWALNCSLIWELQSNFLINSWTYLPNWETCNLCK